MKKRLERKRKGTLHLIAAMLVVSATLRMGAGTGEALAENLLSAAPQPASEADGVAALQEKDALLNALLEREARVAAQEIALEERQKTITAAESEIRKQLLQLEMAEQALRDTMALAETAASDDLARLTAVYENMKPKEAATLFEEMDPEFSAGFLGMMRPEAAALIMTQLQPQTAYSISVILAGRNASVPTD